MNDDNFWVGVRHDTGAMWLYDPSLQHDDPTLIYAFCVNSGEMREYEKAHVKKMLSTVKIPTRQVAIAKYLEWYGKHGLGFIEADSKRRLEAIRKRREVAEERRKSAIERHKAYLIEHGKTYSGVSQNINKKHRVTHCYSCKENLDSSLHIECNTCNWLICYCGACGCGYEKQS